MGLLDYIRNLFNNGKINTKVITKDLSKIDGDKTPLEVGLIDTNGNPLKDKEIIIKINNVNYKKVTDNNGIAKLNINLPIDSYVTLVKFNGDDEYNKSSTYCNVYVNGNIETQDLNMVYNDGSKFRAIIKDNENNPLQYIKTVFNINGVSYERLSNENGIASLNINLDAGTYNITTMVGNNKVNNNIIIARDSTRLEGTNINMTYKDGTKYQCAIYDSKNLRIKDKVNLIINGIKYERLPDEELLYKLNLNLNPGEYTIKAIYEGNNNYKSSEISNSIKISEQPKIQPVEQPKIVKLNSYLSSQGCSGMGQCTGYYCACNSLQQMFYRLTGIQVSEYTIAEVAGTTTAGTDHQGINTVVAWFNRKYGTNIKIEWKNFSDLGSTRDERFNTLQKLINNGAVFIHLLYRNKYGHYEVPKGISNGNIVVYNSLGDYCSYPAYCGYIETRSYSTQESYINGISQKSIAILTI